MLDVRARDMRVSPIIFTFHSTRYLTCFFNRFLSFFVEFMLNNLVEPLLTMANNSNRLIAMSLTTHESNNHHNDGTTKRSSGKTSSSVANASMNSTTMTISNDNRIKFVDMLVCGSCQQDFQLSDIIKFIEHKATCGNKENKQNIPYFLSQQRSREGENYDEEDEDDDNKHQHVGNSHGNENHPYLNLCGQQRSASNRQASIAKALVDASANTSNSTSTLKI